MEFSLFLLQLILLVFQRLTISLCDVSFLSPSLQESYALNALKSNLNNQYLNQNWSTDLVVCDMQPPLWYGIECLNGRVTSISLENMSLTGFLSDDVFFNFTELTKLSLRNNFLSGKVMNFTYNRKLKQLDLSGNYLYGPISSSLLTLDSLESLQLQGNQLVGPVIPLYHRSLTFFNVSGNHLSGPIPKTPLLQSFGYNSYSNNPALCGPPSSNSCDDQSTTKKPHDTLADFAIMFLLLDIIALIAILLLFFVYYKKYNKLKAMVLGGNLPKAKELPTEEYHYDKSYKDISTASREHRIVASNCDKGKLIFMEEQGEDFQLSDLLKASAEGLGKGIFGNTYKAMMDDKPVIVVKRLRDLKAMSSDEFVRQLHTVAALKHPNLLSILGYYCSREEKLLLYRFAEKGNLYDRIHLNRASEKRIPFPWTERLSVARGVGRALEHLHLNTSQPNVAPHSNLKSTNVLFDEDDRVLVSDYGLNSLVALPIAAQRMVCYQSPEYQSLKRLSKKSDVWSYGCLLLELLTGKVSEEVDLSSWVHQAVREEWTAEIFDLEISVQTSAAPGMLKLLQIGIRCSDISPEKRPEMTEVVREVEKIRSVEENPDEDDMSTDDSCSMSIE